MFFVRLTKSPIAGLPLPIIFVTSPAIYIYQVMGFLYPQFLFALFAVAVPIVIHLFNFRRFKKVYFTNVSLLKSLETASRKQNKLYDILLLCLRCLSIIFLVLLFAAPYIKDDDKALVDRKGNCVLVFVDNSFSMENSADKGSLLDVAKQRAKEIVMQYSSSDDFCLMTQDMAGRHKHFVDRESFLEMLRQVEISPCSLPMSKIRENAHRFVQTSTKASKTCFYVSDFQTSCFDAENFAEDKTDDVFVSLKAENANNVFVDSLWFDNVLFKEGAAAELNIRVVNEADRQVDKLPVKLFVDNKQTAVSSVDLKEHEQRVIKMSFTVPHNGILHSKVGIADNPVCFDDDFFFTLLVRERTGVLVINQGAENSFLNRLLGNDTDMELTNMRAENIDFSRFDYQSMIILNGLSEISSGLSSELSDFVAGGGSLVVIPSEDMDLDSYAAALPEAHLPRYGALVEKNARVASIDTENKLFEGVFTSVTDNMEMPEAKKFYTFDKPAGCVWQSVMKFADDEDFLIVSPQGKGDIYLFATAFAEDWCNIVNQSLFVPIVWNMCAMSRKMPAVYYSLADEPFIDLSAFTALNNEETPRVESTSGNVSFIPQMLKRGRLTGLALKDAAKKAGNYDIRLQDSVIGGFSLNYPRTESRLVFLDEGEMKKILKEKGMDNARVFSANGLVESQFAKSSMGFSFSLLLLLLTLMSIAGEILILYKLKK